MIFSVDNTPDGYVVSAYMRLPQDGYDRWHPLRNFGDRQGDAIEFRDYDCPHLDEVHLKVLIRNYDKERKYERVSSKRFIKQGLQ